jgi:hypothetical protein
MGKKKLHRRTIIGQRATRRVIVKSIWTGLDAINHEDYQMLEALMSSTLESIQQEILNHAMDSHPEYTWTIDVFDADHPTLQV